MMYGVISTMPCRLIAGWLVNARTTHPGDRFPSFGLFLGYRRIDAERLGRRATSRIVVSEIGIDILEAGIGYTDT